MLSRIADSLFWLSRYMERADGLIRATTTRYVLSLDGVMIGHTTWRPILETFSMADEATVSALENDTNGTLRILMCDQQNQSSLKVIITRARENARGAQDHITKEAWEEVNALYHLVNQFTGDRFGLQDIIQTLQLFSHHSLLYSGIADVTMPRGLGWSFMNLGKFIERCFEIITESDQHYKQINYNLGAENAIIQWRELLFALSGYELHLKTYRGSNYNRNVLHQVIFNEDFPHSVMYTLERIEKYLNDIVLENQSPDNMELMRSFRRLYSRLKYMDRSTINSANLRHFFDDIKTEMLQISRQLNQNFFSYQ
jgi:uncharacterized alpha-E superfamily protein